MFRAHGTDMSLRRVRISNREAASGSRLDVDHGRDGPGLLPDPVREIRRDLGAVAGVAGAERVASGRQRQAAFAVLIEDREEQPAGLLAVRGRTGGEACAQRIDDDLPELWVDRILGPRLEDDELFEVLVFGGGYEARSREDVA